MFDQIVAEDARLRGWLGIRAMEEARIAEYWADEDFESFSRPAPGGYQDIEDIGEWQEIVVPEFSSYWVEDIVQHEYDRVRDKIVTVDYEIPAIGKVTPFDEYDLRADLEARLLAWAEDRVLHLWWAAHHAKTRDELYSISTEAIEADERLRRACMLFSVFERIEAELEEADARISAEQVRVEELTGEAVEAGNVVALASLLKANVIRFVQYGRTGLSVLTDTIRRHDAERARGPIMRGDWEQAGPVLQVYLNN